MSQVVAEYVNNSCAGLAFPVSADSSETTPYIHCYENTNTRVTNSRSRFLGREVNLVSVTASVYTVAQRCLYKFHPLCTIGRGIMKVVVVSSKYI